VNVYGDSIKSDVGIGAVIQLVPDAPVSLTNDPSITSDLVIRFTWNDGSSNGGTVVIDYAVYYDQGTTNWILLESGVTTNYYLTSTPLNPGITYTFRVQARNTVGYGLDSVELPVLAAK
jgi:hypothetical protein